MRISGTNGPSPVYPSNEEGNPTAKALKDTVEGKEIALKIKDAASEMGPDQLNLARRFLSEISSWLGSWGNQQLDKGVFDAAVKRFIIEQNVRSSPDLEKIITGYMNQAYTNAPRS